MNVNDNLEDALTPSWTEVEDYQGEEVEGLEENSQQSSPIPFLRIIIWTTLVTFVSNYSSAIRGNESATFS